MEITSAETTHAAQPAYMYNRTRYRTSGQILLAGEALVAASGGPPLCIQARSPANAGNGVAVPRAISGNTCPEEVHVTTLDTLAAKAAQRWGMPHLDVSFVKADCEGCEVAALLGFATTLHSHRPPCAIFGESRPAQMRLVSPEHPPTQLLHVISTAMLAAAPLHVYCVTAVCSACVVLIDSPSRAEDFFFSGLRLLHAKGTHRNGG